MDRFIKITQKIILALLLLLFIRIWGGTYLTAPDFFFLTEMTPLQRLGLLAFTAFILFLVLQQAMRRLSICSRRQLIICTAALFVLMTAIYVILIATLRIVPINDSHSLMDQSLTMARTGEKPMSPESIYANYFGKYSNNYLLSLIFVAIYRVCGAVGITDGYLPLTVLNMLALMLGAFLTWHIAYRLRGLAFGAKVLLLSTLNPIYYVSVFWVYSNTLSVPFMMALLDLAVTIYSSKSPLIRFISGISFSITFIFAYFIRPTAVIPVIALVFCVFCYRGRLFAKETLINQRFPKKQGHLTHPQQVLRALVTFGAAIAAALVTYAGITHLTRSYFYTVADHNYPITHWLMMGSHDEGKYNLEDDRFTFKLDSMEEKKDATLKSTFDHYKKLGVAGTLSLWLKKTEIVWSDGYFNADLRLMQTMRYSPVFAWLADENNDLFILYCEGFWCAVVFLVILSCLRQLLSRTVAAFPFLLLLSLLGGILFYFFWEAKPAYAIPFLPLFYLLAADGSSVFSDFVEKRCDVSAMTRGAFAKRRCILCAVGVLLLALSMYYPMKLYRTLTGTSIPHHEYSIKCDSRSWLKTLPLEDGEAIVQTFFPNRQFNRIRLLAWDVPEGEFDTDCYYDVYLSDGSGRELLSREIDVSSIDSDGIVTLDTGSLPASEDSGYTLTLTRHGGSHGDIVFRTRKGALLGAYKGDFSVAGQPQKTDFYMVVENLFEAPYCQRSTALLLCIGGGLLSCAAVLVALGRLKAFSSFAEPTS